MKKLKTPEELAPLVRDYLTRMCHGKPSAKTARIIARAFETNPDNVKSACGILRAQGMLIGFCKKGYYLIDTVDECQVALVIYGNRLAAASLSFHAITENARARFGDAWVDSTLKKMGVYPNGNSQKNKSDEQKQTDAGPDA